MTNKRIRLIVNAIPLINVNTGIGRYLQCLYAQLERRYGDQLDIGYFDGNKIQKRLPRGPADLNRWSRRVDLFWQLPALPALFIRILRHYHREILFNKLAKDFQIYHEPSFFPFGAASRIKTAFTVHDLSLLRFPQFHPRERVLFYRLFFRRRCRDVDSFLSISEFTRREMLSLLGMVEKDITVTHLAHDPSIFYMRPIREIEEVRRRYLLPEKYFIFIGPGDPRKNMLTVPKALKQSGLGIPVATVGWSGWDCGVKSQNEVIQLGYVDDDDLASLYSGALTLIYPSLYEGFGLPVLEAMACGCPVICSDKASLPEVAKDAALYLDDPLDSGKLAQALRYIALDSERIEFLARKGRLQAAGFSWEETARKTYEVFYRMVS